MEVPVTGNKDGRAAMLPKPFTLVFPVKAGTGELEKASLGGKTIP